MQEAYSSLQGFFPVDLATGYNAHKKSRLAAMGDVSVNSTTVFDVNLHLVFDFDFFACALLINCWYHSHSTCFLLD